MQVRRRNQNKSYRRRRRRKENHQLSHEDGRDPKGESMTVCTDNVPQQMHTQGHKGVSIKCGANVLCEFFELSDFTDR